jgi:hypothetical protein
MTGSSWCVISIYGIIWLSRNFPQRISLATLTWTPTTCYRMMSSGTLIRWDSMQRCCVSPLNFLFPPNSFQAIYCDFDLLV